MEERDRSEPLSAEEQVHVDNSELVIYSKKIAKVKSIDRSPESVILNIEIWICFWRVWNQPSNYTCV